MITQRRLSSSAVVGVTSGVLSGEGDAPELLRLILPGGGRLNSPVATSKEARSGSVGEATQAPGKTNEEAVDSRRRRIPSGGETGSKSVIELSSSTETRLLGNALHIFVSFMID